MSAWEDEDAYEAAYQKRRADIRRILFAFTNEESDRVGSIEADYVNGGYVVRTNTPKGTFWVPPQALALSDDELRAVLLRGLGSVGKP